MHRWILILLLPEWERQGVFIEQSEKKPKRNLKPPQLDHRK